MPPKLSSFDAIIFDCDGTLVDSEPISQRVLVDLVGELGLELCHDTAAEHWTGRDLHEVLVEIEAGLGKPLPSDFLDTFRVAQMKRLETDVQPLAGAQQILAQIAETRVARCVASNAPTTKVRLCLETTNLLQFFDANRLFSAYDVQAWKPKPSLFLYAAEQMGISPNRCAVIEDSRFGVKAGIAAEMFVFSLDETDGKTEPAFPSDRVHPIKSLLELAHLI